MPLPILNQKGPSGPADQVRLFLKTEGLWCEHLASPEPLDAGTAYLNPQLDQVYNANNIRDVALPDGMSPQEAFDQVEAYFAGQRCTCWVWTMNPAVSPERTRPMVELLESRGYRPASFDLYALDRSPQNTIVEVAGLRIIPARASFRHARRLLDQYVNEFWRIPQLTEAAMLHLDDPHYDALLALKGDEPVAFAGVLAVGEVGRIDQVYVAPAHRNQGIGRTMMSRAVEICARSLFRVVLMAVDTDNAAAIRLYQKFGFNRAGQITSYRHPKA